jgi:hypothetical protein
MPNKRDKDATPFVLNPLPPVLLLYLWLPVPWYACFQKNWYFIIASTWFCVSTGSRPLARLSLGGAELSIHVGV